MCAKLAGLARSLHTRECCQQQNERLHPLTDKEILKERETALLQKEKGPYLEEPFLILKDRGPSLELKDREPSLVLNERGPSLILKERGPSLVQKEKGPSLVQKEKGTSLVQKEKGTSLVQKVREPLPSWQLLLYTGPYPLLPTQ